MAKSLAITSWMLILSVLLPGACTNQKLLKGEFLDYSCRLFRFDKTNKENWVIEKLTTDRRVIARETVDCSKAVHNIDGSWNYNPTITDISIWCKNSNPIIVKKILEEQNNPHPNKSINKVEEAKQ